METNKSTRLSGGWYLLGGLIIGAAAGLLYAPKEGSQTREDISDWRRINRKKALAWLASIGDSLPARVKAAAGIGAVKSGASEALHIAKEKVNSYVGT